MVSRALISVLLLTLLPSVLLAQKCIAQSCAIAALSGSTDESFDEIVQGMGGKAPTGSNSAGKNCITKYYKQLGLKGPKSIPKVKLVSDMPTHSDLENRTTAALQKRQGCKPNILVFARGTMEMGTMGSTVGPALSRALGSKFRSVGVKYTADIAGDNCIGFPGGIKCVDQLAKLAQQCPTSSFFLSGYSQGAMVAHICTAFSKDEVKKRIKGVVVFGDPFNGASIKGFPRDGIKTFCNAGDGVCQGKFVITAAHLAYTAGPVRQAAKWMASRAAS